MNTNNPIVDAVGAMHFEGNIIPHLWYCNLTLENRKPDLVAIILLSEIVYWYRPTVVKDETTGALLGFKKRFKSDLLQRTYDSFVEQFGFSKRQAQDAMTRLEKRGVIKKHLRTFDNNGTRLGNVLFIELVPDVLRAITFESTPSHVIKGEVSRYNETPITFKRETNTEITTEITTDINNNNDTQQTNEPKFEKINPFQFYTNNGFGLTMNDITRDEIGGWCDDLSDELVVYAMQVAIEQNRVKWVYVRKILNSWYQQQIKTVEQVKALEAEREREKGAYQHGRGTNKPNASHQRQSSTSKVNAEARLQENNARLEKFIQFEGD